MNEKREGYPDTLPEYGVVLEHLEKIRKADRDDAKQALYRLLDEAYRKGYKAGQES